jgi:hypothetical protein
MQSRSDLIETPAEDRQALESGERSQDVRRSQARAHQSHARHQAAAAEFERLRARLRQLVGTNNPTR